MTRLLAASGLAAAALVGVVFAQTPKPADPPAADGDLDPTSKQAASLESQLAKTSSTSKDAAELMLHLMELYHANARPFGLVRVAQSFVSLHPTHPRHRDAMLRLIDGLQATGRNKELIAAGRQFLSRHPADPAAAEVERWLLRLLRRANDLPGAAAVAEAHWKRLGPGDVEGVRAGRDALGMYLQMGTPDALAKAAALGDEMLDKLPAGGSATAAGWAALDAQERLSHWAKANLVAVKLAQKSPPPTPYYQQYLFYRIAENYARQGQRANAAEFWKKALAVPGTPPRPDIHARLIEEVVHNNPKPADLEPIVDDYLKKFSERPDRFAARIRLAGVYSANNDKAKAEQILTEVLPHDARSHSASSAYAQLFGGEADPKAKQARLAQAEQTLRGAIDKSTPANAAALRYTLALEILRDRAQDVPKAKAAARELIAATPANDGYTQGTVNWLLDAAADDAEFHADVARVLDARKKSPWVSTFRGTLAGWAQARLNNKDLAKRAQFAQAELAKADRDPAVTPWLALEKAAAENNMSPAAAAARTKILTGNAAALPDDVAGDLLYHVFYYLRHYAPDNQRVKSIDAAKAWAARFPKSLDAAAAYLSAATDFAKPDHYRDAAAGVYKLPPTATNTDLARRLAAVAAHFKDADLGKQAWTWTKGMYDKFGYDPGNATGIGDALAALGLKDEAKDCWTRAVAGNPDSGELRESASRLANLLPEAERPKFYDTLLPRDTASQFSFAVWKADALLKAGDVAGAVALLPPAAAKTRQRFGGGSLDQEHGTLYTWVGTVRADPKMPAADKEKLFAAVRDLRVIRASMLATAALLELPDSTASKLPPMKRLLLLAEATQLGYGDGHDFDLLSPYVQAAMARKDYLAAATLTSGMLANLPGLDDGRKKAGRDLLTQAYTRLGAAGGAVIDEKSPIAPLLSAALQLRLGDQKLAFETYLANQKLFDEHRAEVPVDLLVFVADSHMAAGGDENHNRVEDILRSWLVKNGESKEVDEVEKARVQLLLARNYFRSKRYDLARAEYTTVLNRYAKTPQAVDAEFGIGETFMEQKVYDQAEQAFEKLANSRERDVVIRAEFLRGVLASRRGDRDEARAIFRGVLERVPNVELANQALFNLSEVYGAEQRYVDQLELLRTVGRLGRASKRFHAPGDPLSIVVQDSDLGVSRGHSRIPVRVVTEPGGDEETIYLLSGGAGKGLFRADLETRLGSAAKNDRVLQLTGKDVIRVDYPPAFKQEFKDAPLPDAEIRVAADGRLEMASGKITDEDEETFSQKLAKEAGPNGDDEDKRKGVVRPKDQVKPGNVAYLRVKDADRDLTDKPDTIQLRLAAASGDQVAATLTETGPHTGVFEGTVKTGELPAGALATNTAIDHSPLMAIDKDPKSAWKSEPDGATPKFLAVDMKDLKRVDRVSVSTPDAKQYAPVRTTLEGSDDGRLWFRLATTHPDPAAAPVAFESGPMAVRVYEVPSVSNFANWDAVVALTKNAKPVTEGKAADLFWARTPDEKNGKNTAVVWHGKLVQPKAGAARFAVSGDATAVMVDGRLELPVGPGNRTADVYLDAGTHDLTIFTAARPTTQTIEAKWAAAGDSTSQTVTPAPFRALDFDLTRPEAKTAPAPRALGTGTADKDGTTWEFAFPPISVRHVRATIHEYRGEAVAISNVVIRDSEKNVTHIPTEADLLSLATNDVLEIAGGDVVTATYIDDVNPTGGSRLLTAKLTATYHNGTVTAIGYDFEKRGDGQVVNLRKEVLRIDPGERVILEVTDYDQDQTGGPDKVVVQVAVNDGPPVELEATETQENSGIFTKEIDTTAGTEAGKLTVKPGDRLFLRYADRQNTVPGHAHVRETVVYVNEPTPGRVRVVETRAAKPANAAADAAPVIRYLPRRDGDEPAAAGVSFEAPFTVEVIDRDAAKDSRSTVTVTLTTTDGSTVEVECVLSDSKLGANAADRQGSALAEGRFTGQVVMLLGGKDSPALVPLTASMPRNLIGGPKLPKEENGEEGRDKAVVTKVLNLTGADTVEAAYTDARRPGAGETKLTATARLLTDGKLSATDAEYLKDVTAAHVGERLFLRVVDADLDRTPERDRAKVRVKTARGEDETVELEETLSHSGVFTGSVLLKPAEKPTAGNINRDVPEIECYFGDTIEAVYADERASSGDGKLASAVSVLVVIGTDGKLQAFSKAFGDEALAVETQFHIAESHFELFKSHKALGRDAEARTDLESGRRVLREVMEDYPNPKYAPRVAYLLGQFAQELKQFGEAVQSYQLIVKQFPDHALAPDAQFKLAQCYEDAGEFNQALEAYVTLAATYPKNPLIANVMVRISEHFYKAENFKVAAQVGEKFLEKFDGHKWGPKMAFRVGQCHFKDKQYDKAAAAFDRFAKTFRDDPLGPDALFWSGESYRTAGNMKKAFESYNKCRWDYPASEASKYARGRLALPEMLQQFEAAAASVEDNK